MHELDIFAQVGLYATAGTERGLGIPSAPRHLTFSRDPKTGNVRLRWKNPDSGYDQLRIPAYPFPALPGGSEEFSPSAFIARLSEKAPAYYVQLLGSDSEFPFYLLALKNGVASNHSGIYVKGSRQEDRFCVPFSFGVAPNWSAWSPCQNRIIMQQGQAPEIVGEAFGNTHGEEGNYSQIIGAKSAGGVGGVYRMFLGLNAGHAYRLTMRVNTLDMGICPGKWSYSIYAAPHRNDDDPPFTATQFAGEEPLPEALAPEGRVCLASFNSQHTTQGKWEIFATGGGADTPDLAMINGCSTLTVWASHHADAPTSGVAFDYISLEDLGIIGEHAAICAEM